MKYQVKGIVQIRFSSRTGSPDYLEACNFLGYATCVRCEIVNRVFNDSRGVYDFLLRATEIAQRVAHVRRVLVHRMRGLDRPKPPEHIAEEIRAIEGRLRRTGRVGKVSPLKPDTGCYNVTIHRSDEPLISVVIPAAGRIIDIEGRRVDLLLNCVDAIVSRSAYKNLEVVAVDDGNIDDARRSVLRACGLRRCRIVGQTRIRQRR